MLAELGLLDKVFIILLEIGHVQGLTFAHYAIIFITADKASIRDSDTKRNKYELFESFAFDSIWFYYKNELS